MTYQTFVSFFLGQLRRTEPSKPWSSIFLFFLRKQELLAIFYTAAILLPPPLWQALQIPAHKNNQTQEQLLSLCHHSPELLISGVIPTLAIHLHITYFIIPICILHNTFALLLCTLHPYLFCILFILLCILLIKVLNPIKFACSFIPANI